jgi:hypothetical protein
MSDGEQLDNLEIPLTNRIKVYDLQAFLSGINTVYFSSLWLELATEARPGQPFPDEYAPSEEEDLWIAELEIGTPNRLKIRGRQNQLKQVLAFVTAISAAATATAGAFNSYEQARNAYEQSQLAKIEIVEKAQTLYAQGKISKIALDHKIKELPDELIESVIAVPNVVQMRSASSTTRSGQSG